LSLSWFPDNQSISLTPEQIMSDGPLAEMLQISWTVRNGPKWKERAEPSWDDRNMALIPNHLVLKCDMTNLTIAVNQMTKIGHTCIIDWLLWLALFFHNPNGDSFNF
jgi:hypothetical protein